LVNNRFLDINIFKRDCLRISELGKEKIKEIRLLGGEPLLHPQLCDVIDIIGTLFNKNVVTIVTNGILLLEQKNIFWNICSKYNAKICITKYPVKINFKAIEKMARKYSVNLVYYGNTDVQIKTMHCIPLDLSGMQKKSFDLCFNANNCPQLRDGKIFPCATAAYFEYFNDFFCKNIQTSTEDYIDIYKTKTIDEILAFLCHPVPFCRYCKTQKTIRGIKWGISEKEISEWVK
jgi:MoaA/NifB/PqqE/SkfB family radical SAM enzyme